MLLVLGIAASMIGLARLAIAGFAAGGHLPTLVLTACAAGLLATLFSSSASAPIRACQPGGATGTASTTRAAPCARAIWQAAKRARA